MKKNNYIYKDNESDIIIALVGNPNVGKSTIFNALTGLNQHTGNWTGKTVSSAYGKYTYKEEDYILVDLPGTYSLNPSSKEEEVTRDFLYYNNPNLTIVVIDATKIERNLNLVLQTLEVTKNVILCINLIDEAERKKIDIDIETLKNELKIPIITTSAKNDNGLDKLKNEIYKYSYDLNLNPKVIKYNDDIENSIKIIQNELNVFLNNNLSRIISIKLLSDDSIIESLYNNLNINLLEERNIIKTIKNEQKKYENIKKEISKKLILESERIFIKSVKITNQNYNTIDKKIDKIVTSKKCGILIMTLLFLFIFWLTINAANCPSEVLSNILFKLEYPFYKILELIKLPQIIINPLVYGVYRTLSWVVSVMLPPMIIFFPLFTLLEDIGYLPRLTFNLDKFFNRACVSGKQVLTMCMGFGCNACAITNSRIIDTKRERLIAIITNSFVPCNGRFPTIITLIAIFFTSSKIKSSIILTCIILFSIFITLITSKILSKTILKGKPSSYILELPSYKKPQITKIIIKSILEKTYNILKRAIIISAPIGLIIWILSNNYINDISILKYISETLNPFANVFGIDGVILMGFILGFPANEIVLPIIIMTYMSESTLTTLDISSLKTLLINNGWTTLTAICTLILCLFHFPCGTTCLTIKKETNSLKWTIIAFVLPIIIGLSICFIINFIYNII